MLVHQKRQRLNPKYLFVKGVAGFVAKAIEIIAKCIKNYSEKFKGKRGK